MPGLQAERYQDRGFCRYYLLPAVVTCMVIQVTLFTQQDIVTHSLQGYVDRTNNKNIDQSLYARMYKERNKCERIKK
ncbi:MAG: hypothetical protein CL947_00870 [Epsilonproteobacteria bacterium]|nr:hypothetical protein [Campylobacterota bacterium]|tara:strand:+ start:76 stop:306 length:231 start_codon:yes stop_codon:yes gene_type:complete